MVGLYLLDTNIVSYLVKGVSPKIEAKLKDIEPELVCISAITKAELLYGLESLGQPKHPIHIAVREFLKLIRILPWDEEAATYYAIIRQQLTSQGKKIGEMDMMIAAHAMALGAILVTHNMKHFGRIEALILLEDWMD